MRDEKVRKHFGDYLGMAEVAILTILAVLISLTALATIARSSKLLWDSWHQWMAVTDTGLVLRVLDQLLVVLMLVEILHTVRISIRSHTLVTEPFLVVGLIASIRRILVITLEAATLTKEGKWTPEGATIFHASMIELGLLGLLIFILVYCIVLLRRTPEKSEEEFSVPDAQSGAPRSDANVAAPSSGPA
jgi:uncharacterized membrane protein (DUF373 family)